MTQAQSLPEYNKLNTELKKAQSLLDASQFHGLICGFICASTEPLNSQSEKKLLGTASNPAICELLQKLYQISEQQISEFSFDFALLLPADKTDINVRTEALGLWCQGFLSGLQAADFPIEHREPGELTEAINDIIEIAKVNFEEIAATEEDETAYFELADYVRLVVLMVYHEVNSPPVTTTPDKSSLH